MTLRITMAEGRRDLARFIDVPWRVIDARRHPAWVPPLRVAVEQTLDTERDPFYRNAERSVHATRNGRTVGRVAAIENRAHNEHFGDRVGFFGYFECIEDGSVADALLAQAEAWLQRRGLQSVRGPVSPSMNYECGVLVDGFDERHVVLTPWNPPYYGRLIERAGYGPTRDLLGYDIPLGRGFVPPARLARVAERALRSSGLRFRDIDYGRGFEQDIGRVQSVWNEAWAENWGFVPADRVEFGHLAVSLKPILGRKFSFIAEVDGEPVGFMLIAADMNLLIGHGSSGRLTPALLAKLLFRTQRMKSGRVILLGLKRGHRHKGLFALMLYEAMRRGVAIRAERAEASWVLEDNDALRAPIEELGMKPHRRWRMYEKPLGVSESAGRKTPSP